jgi:hypothetical protein
MWEENVCLELPLPFLYWCPLAYATQTLNHEKKDLLSLSLFINHMASVVSSPTLPLLAISYQVI